MSTINGQVDAVNAGNNDSGIVYNKVMLEEGGYKASVVPEELAGHLERRQGCQEGKPEGLHVVAWSRCRSRCDQRPAGNRQSH